MLCFQKTGAEIGEFLTPLIFLCHSYKKWTLEGGLGQKIPKIWPRGLMVYR